MGDAGLNLPPTQGTTNAGAFIPGVYRYDYTVQNIRDIRAHGFSAIRLPVNVSTALDVASMAKFLSYIDAIGGRGIMCMFEEAPCGATGANLFGDGHGTGRVRDPGEIAIAWTSVHQVFSAHPGVMYEIFNEPFGYSSPEEYLEVMRKIIGDAKLPMDRCILDGFGYASDVQVLDCLGWKGFLAYHFYPMWLPDGQRTQEMFSNKLRADLGSLGSRAYLTEFGASLNIANERYDNYLPSGDDGNVNCLRGLHDGLKALKHNGQAVRGVFHWHGWHNGDCYDFWDEGNKNGALKIQSINYDVMKPLLLDTSAMQMVGKVMIESEHVPVMIFRKEEMTYLVAHGDSILQQMSRWGWKYERMAFNAWANAEEPGVVPIHCFRKDEIALYRHCGSQDWNDLGSQGWKQEKVAFYAYSPHCGPRGLAEVHEWRKDEKTYYTRDDWDGWGSMAAWGWTYGHVAFCARNGP